MSSVNRWIQALLQSNHITCIICQHRRRDNELLCRHCADQIPWITHIQCRTCGRSECCSDCTRRNQAYFVMNRSAVRYDEMMKQWLAQYKYRGHERLQALLTQMLSYAYLQLERELLHQHQAVHAITYVPLSEERMEERGFNQAEKLAKGLATIYKLPCIPLLTRNVHTDKQSYKKRAERMLDLRHAFKIKPTALQAFHKLRASSSEVNIILVDDVYTTGSTLNECARVIQRDISANIYGLTWAR